MTATKLSSVIPGVRERPGNDPIFALNAEASQRAAHGLASPSNSRLA